MCDRGKHRTSNVEPRTPNATVVYIVLSAFAALLLCTSPARGADDPDVKERRTRHLLIRDLGDKKLAVRVEAERKLKKLGESAVPDLILALDGRHIAVSTMAAGKREMARARAASVLGALGGERAAKHLIKALDDKTTLVKRGAINALGAMRCKEAVPKLLKLVSGKDAVLASDSILALGAIGDKSAGKDVLAVFTGRDALKKRYKNDADVSRVRCVAAFSLGMLGDTAAVPALLAGLRDTDAKVRRHADLALRKMSGRTLGFKADAPEPERERTAKAWDAWWKAKLK